MVGYSTNVLFTKSITFVTAIWKAGALTSDLLKECASAKQLEIDLQENLNALSRQLMLARYQCFPKDRNLCDTLQPVGLEVAFFITNVCRAFLQKQCSGPFYFTDNYR